MRKSAYLKSVLAGSASAIVLASSAFADQFNIPGGNLANALDAYAEQTGVQLLIADDAVRDAQAQDHPRQRFSKTFLLKDVEAAAAPEGGGQADHEQHSEDGDRQPDGALLTIFFPQQYGGHGLSSYRSSSLVVFRLRFTSMDMESNYLAHTGTGWTCKRLMVQMRA